MIDLNDIALFVQVIRSGSFAGAARRLGTPSNTVSRRIQNLEAQLGMRLLQRSTRKLTLTHCGQQFHDRCAASVEELNEAARELMSGTQEPTGLVRVAAPADFFDFFLMDWTASFLDNHPKVSLEFILSDTKTDLIAERVDVAFRGGALQDSSFIGRQVISDSKDGLVASPDYISIHGLPKSLPDLMNHACIASAHPSGNAAWRLKNEQGIDEEFRFTARLTGNTIQSQRRAAINGIGIALLPQPVAKRDLDAGLLVRVLPQYKRAAGGLHVIYPSRRHLPLAVSAFIELAIEKLNEQSFIPTEPS